jgi:nucleotide-binding universal stress UspA family protein
MTMKILVAVDGSAHAVRALRHAIKLSEALKEPAEITLISVHEDTGLQHAARFAGQQELREYLADLSAQDLKGALAAARKAAVSCRTVTATGHAATQIVETARKGRFDLIAMGAKGRGAIQDLLMGSVAQRVIELSRVPVLLVK